MKLIKYIAILLATLAVALIISIKLAPKEVSNTLIDVKRSIGGLEKHSVTLSNNLEYVYLEAGEEYPEVLVLLHGFGADKDHFTEVAPYLKNNFHLIVPDHIGFGESSNPPNIDYSPVAQAIRLHHFLTQELGLNRYHMGGSSMGGHIALTYASLYPSKVKSLWLLDPGGLWSSPKSEMFSIIEKTGKHPLLAKTTEDYHKIFDFVMSKPPFVPGFVLDEKAEVRISNYELEKRIFKAIKSDNVEERIQGLETPTLVVWGEEDRVLHPGAVEVIEDLMPNVESIIMPGIGHLPMLEAPRETAKDLKEFISDL